MTALRAESPPDDLKSDFFQTKNDLINVRRAWVLRLGKKWYVSRQ
jgi:hypothetical protein